MTVFANIDRILGYLERHAGRQRVKTEPNQCDPPDWVYDLPEATSKVVDVRTSKIAERIAVIDDFVEAGYEGHVNFSPVIVHEGWLEDWADLLDHLADGTSARTKAQLAAEIIFLTHNEDLHNVNLGWHPQGEDLLWRPDLQQSKQSQSGQGNVRYRSPWKGRWVAQLNDLIAASFLSAESGTPSEVGLLTCRAGGARRLCVATS